MKPDVSAPLKANVFRNSLLVWVMIWLFWTEAEAVSWIIGLPILAAAAMLVRRLESPEVCLRVGCLPRFAGFFLFESIRGGWDVARRALARDMRLQPEMINFDTVLDDGPARVFLINCISLMPGTATVEHDEGHLKLHVLDGASDCETEIRRLEAQVATLFGDAGQNYKGEIR